MRILTPYLLGHLILLATLAGATPVPLPTRTPTEPVCVGDCDGNQRVSIAELVRIVTIALGRSPIMDCPAADANGDAQIRISDIVVAVNRALRGCRAIQPRYMRARLFNAGSAHRGLTVGDFDLDGLLDIVVADVGAPRLSVLGGNGDGSFSAALTSELGITSFAIDSGDLDEDGLLDIVTANDFVGNDAAIALGAGDHSLTLTARVPTGEAPVAVAIGDLNDDRHLDFVIANNGTADVSVYFGDGSGSFAQQPRVSVGQRPRGVIVADLNGDAIADIATANITSGDVSVALGLGGGTFADDRRFSVGDAPHALVAADLDGDGITDIAAVNEGSNDVSFLRGLGGGNFDSESRHSVGRTPSAIAAADLNGDGSIDLATANIGDSTVSILIGNRGVFAPEQAVAALHPANSLVVADVDDNGIPDLITASTDGTVSILLGN